MESRLRKAKCIAEFILRWHQIFGKSKIQKMAPEFYKQYLARLDSLSKLDLTKPEHLRLVANEQTMGSFAYFYGEPIPQILWNELVQNVVDLSMPENLGSVGLLILQLLQGYEYESEAAATFQLPEGWHDKATLLRPGHVKLPMRPNKTPRETLRDYFANLSEMEDLGIGGRELMIAMNEDLREPRDIPEEYIIAYNPASFNFQLATGEGNLVTRVIQGEITISEVLLGCDPEYGEKAHRE
jgi:hypothetical protein